MWSNTDKIMDTLQEIFMLMEKIEMEHMEMMKQDEKNVIETSLVSNLDLTGEYDKYKKAMQVLQAWTQKSSEDSYYAFFGKLWMYQRFVKKDLFGVSAQAQWMIGSLINMIIRCLSVLSLVLVIYTLFFISSESIVAEIIRTYSIRVACFGTALCITFFLPKNQLIFVVIRILISIVVWIILSTAVINNFWL